MKFITIIFFILFGFCYSTLITNAKCTKSTETTEIFLIKNQFRDYFRFIAGVASAHPADKANAANGHFTLAVTRKAEILDLPKRNIGPFSCSDPEKLWPVWKLFYNDSQKIFKKYSVHDTSWTRNPDVRRQILKANMSNVVKAIGIVFGISSGNETQAAKAAGELAQKYHKGNPTDVAGSGEWANGHIRPMMDGLAKKCIELLNENFSPSYNGPARPTIDALQDFFIAFPKIPYESTDAWLSPEWQYGFELVLRAGAIRLEQTKPIAPDWPK